MQFLGQHLQTPGDFPQFGRTVVGAARARAAHELQVVHHDEPELAALARQAPGVGAQFAWREARGFIDVQRHCAQLFNRLGQARPLVVRELAGSQVALVHTSNRTHDTHGQLSSAHFHREDGDRQAFVKCHMLGNVHRKRGLPHRRTSCQHDHVARLQPRSHPVQISKACGHPRHVRRVVSHLLHFVEQVNHQRIERLKPLLVARAFLANGEDLGFRFIQDALDGLALRIKRVRGNLIAGGDQLAQDGSLPHDFGIATDVAGAGDVLRQIIQVRQPSHLFRLAQAAQVFKHRDHIGGLAGIHQARNRGEDQLMFMAIEVAFGQQISHAVPGIVVEQQPTQHTGLSFHRMGRNAQTSHLTILNMGCSKALVI